MDSLWQAGKKVWRKKLFSFAFLLKKKKEKTLPAVDTWVNLASVTHTHEADKKNLSQNYGTEISKIPLWKKLESV